MSETIAIERKALFKELLMLDLSKCIFTICLASIVKDGALPIFERVQITDKATGEFRSIIKQFMRKYIGEWNLDDLLFIEYATESIPESFEVQHIGLSDYKAILEQLAPLSSLINIEVFNEDEYFVDGLRFYVITVQPPIGDPIYFFRLYTHKKMLDRSWYFSAWKQNGSYDVIKEPTLLFDQDIDCVSRGDFLYIFNRNNFESIFRFFVEIQKSAKKTLEIIKNCIPFMNFDDFASDCERHLWKMRKLMKMATKPYLRNVTIEHITKVIAHNKLPIEIRRVGETEMIVYNKKYKWELLKLLDDNYLWSELTEQNYVVSGKQELP